MRLLTSDSAAVYQCELCGQPQRQVACVPLPAGAPGNVTDTWICVTCAWKIVNVFPMIELAAAMQEKEPPDASA